MENIEKLRLHGEEREHTSTSTTSRQHNTQILRYRGEKSRLLRALCAKGGKHSKGDHVGRSCDQIHIFRGNNI